MGEDGVDAVAGRATLRRIQRSHCREGNCRTVHHRQRDGTAQ
jgi:hypothetical protein